MGKSSSPPPPDYTPMAEASLESTKIMAGLGQQQIDFAQRQYDDQRPFAERIAQQQIGIADQTAAQGQDYYDYMKSFRPTEQAMMAEAMQDQSGEISAFDAANQRDAATMAADDASLYGANRGLIDQQTGQAVADVQGGYTRSLNQAMRQGLRYGAGNANLIGQVGNIGLQQASNVAGTANMARMQGIQDIRGRAGTALGLRGQNINALNAQRAIGWAKKLDAAGLVRGMPGASQGAYGLAIGAGSAAAANRAAPGQQFQTGLAAGAGTIGEGRKMYQSGLGSIMDAQAGVYSDQMRSKSASSGAMIGAIGGIGAAFAGSDRRLKTDIRAVGELFNGLTVYTFRYKSGGPVVMGVMADEVKLVIPDAVIEKFDGVHDAVDYSMLGE